MAGDLKLVNNWRNPVRFKHLLWICLENARKVEDGMWMKSFRTLISRRQDTVHPPISNNGTIDCGNKV
jgi:hypothetical protein